MPTIEELRDMQALNLPSKVLLTEARIREWVSHYGLDKVYVSFSGGKDSTVLLHIARQMYPDIKAMFVDTGLEYPEIKAFVKGFDNVDITRPKKTFKQVICEYGYPLLSKQISHAVGIAKRNPRGKIMQNLFISDKFLKSKFCMKKWKPLIYCDFDMSDKCCYIMKKKTAHSYKTGGKCL